jgi:flagellar biosynthesis protein FlhG
MQVLPIASGKGGVGKSLVAANLAVALSQAGKEVLLVDMDLGASNLHLLLGISGVQKGIGTYLSNHGETLDEIVVETEYSGLRFIPGDAEIPGMASVRASRKNALVRKLLEMKADYLIMDLGAGSGNMVMDCFLTSGQGIIVTAPTLTATLNAYLFLKNAVFRILSSSLKKNGPAYEYLEALRREGTGLQKVYVPRILAAIKEKDPAGYDEYRKKIFGFHPQLILNLLDDPADAQKAAKIRRSCKEYLDVDVEHLGIIYRDHFQDIALSSRLPIIVYKPPAVLSQAISRIADKLIQQPEETAGFLDMDQVEESFQTAEMEADIDFESKVQDVEALLQSGALTRGDLIEPIKTQQYEISTLKKENQLLKSRLVRAFNEGFKIQ